MGYNLAELSKEEMDRVNVDLAASGVAYKERYNMPVIPEVVEREQPEALRDYFRERVAHYRAESHRFSRLPYEPKVNNKTRRYGGFLRHLPANRSVAIISWCKMPGSSNECPAPSTICSSASGQALARSQAFCTWQAMS